MIYDAIIIGAGVAGMAAARFMSRSKTKYLLLEKFAPGGKASKIIMLDNMPSVDPVSGYDFTLKLYSELRKIKAPMIFDEVLGIYKAKTFFVVHTASYDYQTKNVVFGAGTGPKKLYIPNEENYEGRGISYCALCDGHAYENQDVMVLGGGDSAVEAANMLSKICHHVYLVHRKKEFKAKEYLVKKIKKINNITIIDDSLLIELYGYPVVSGAVLQDNMTKEITNIDIKCLFIYVGQEPNTEILKSFDVLDESGYVIVNKDMETSVPGLYAIGDCTANSVKLVITALSDGVIASADIWKKL